MKCLKCYHHDIRASALVGRTAPLQSSSRRQQTRFNQLGAAKKEDSSTGVVMVSQESSNGNGNGSSNGQGGAAPASSITQPLLPQSSLPSSSSSPVKPPLDWSGITLYKVQQSVHITDLQCLPSLLCQSNTCILA
jgi:hypothetical protein